MVTQFQKYVDNPRQLLLDARALRVKAMRQAHTHEILSSVFSCDTGSVVIVKDIVTGEEFTLKMTVYQVKPIQTLFESLLGKPKNNRLKNFDN